MCLSEAEAENDGASLHPQSEEPVLHNKSVYLSLQHIPILILVSVLLMGLFVCRSLKIQSSYLTDCLLKGGLQRNGFPKQLPFKGESDIYR